MSTMRLPFERDTTGGQTDGVVTVTLTQPGRSVVVLDRALLESIDATLDEIASAYGNDMAGFVLASASRVFVAGADLKEIMAQDDAGLDTYLRFGSTVYGRIAGLSCTTVAAINGATLGGGLEIAMHCDRLIAASPGERKPYQIGLPESGLCICPGWGGTNLLPARMDAARAITLTATGQTMGIDEAAQAGLVEELVDADDLLARARECACAPKVEPRVEPVSITNPGRREEALAGLEAVRGELPDTGSARGVVACVEAGLADGWEAALEAERRTLISLRNSAEGSAAIEAFFARSRG